MTGTNEPICDKKIEDAIDEIKSVLPLPGTPQKSIDSEFTEEISCFTQLL